MTLKVSCIIILVLCLNYGLSQTDFVRIQRHFEFENVLTEDQKSFWVWRSEASKLKTLRLEDMIGEYKVFFRICLDPIDPDKNVTLQIANIRYSNDGPSDTCYISLNDQIFSVFYTFERWRSGHEWNVFRNTGPVSRPMELPPGEYELGLSVNTDKWGVEFDRISINTENQNMTSDVFCGSGLKSYRL